jgi:LuxR family quorum-sensing system transcriptional regulator CciR
MHKTNHLDLVQSFIENCETDAPGAFHKTVLQLGFRYFACISHRTNPFCPAPGTVMVHNYPTDWVKRYVAEQLGNFDPVLRRAEEDPMPFFWDMAFGKQSLTPMQRRVLMTASEFGLVHGYTIPIHLSWTPGSLRASCSIVPNGTAEMSSYRAMELLATYFFAAVNPQPEARCPRSPRLTRREKQCLELVAGGKDDGTMSRMLQLSERTVHEYVERAKHRFSVATRIQAVVRALATGQISFGDVLRVSSE